MRRHGNLWPKILDLNNILTAHCAARKGKSHYAEVVLVDSNPELYCKKIQSSLQNKEFTTSPYIIENKFDGRKNRIIYKLPYYPDRIVQHALLQVCIPIWRNLFIRDTFQSIEKRGTSDARKRITKLVRQHPILYGFKFDIEQYYPSINNDKLKKIIRQKIKCPDTLWLLDNIIDSCRGLPIGNYTSQYLGNLYLNHFDWWSIQNLNPVGYYRYCDDIIILCKKKDQCWKAKQQMETLLRQDFNLKIKNNWSIFPVHKQGLDFVGFKFYFNRTILRPTIAKNFRIKCKQVIRSFAYLPRTKIVNGLMSYWGWAKYVNAKHLWQTHVTPQHLAILNGVKENEPSSTHIG